MFVVAVIMGVCGRSVFVVCGCCDHVSKHSRDLKRHKLFQHKESVSKNNRAVSRYVSKYTRFLTTEPCTQANASGLVHENRD